jgi:CheY-like chemotaxis protein
MTEERLTGHADRLRVLLVEDDPTMAEGYRTKLELDGYRVELASDSGTALRRAAADPPDLMFLESRLRWTGDLDLLQALRQDQRTCLVPVVVLATSDEAGIGDSPADASVLSHLVITRNLRPRPLWALVH